MYGFESVAQWHAESNSSIAVHIDFDVDKCATVNCGANGDCQAADGTCKCKNNFTGATCATAPKNTPVAAPTAKPTESSAAGVGYNLAIALAGALSYLLL